MTDPHQNKQIVREFYELAFNGKRPADAVERYVGSKYIQHNDRTAPAGGGAPAGPGGPHPRPHGGQPSTVTLRQLRDRSTTTGV